MWRNITSLFVLSALSLTAFTQPAPPTPNGPNASPIDDYLPVLAAIAGLIGIVVTQPRLRPLLLRSLSTACFGLLVSIGFAQNTYYTCNTSSGTNLSGSTTGSCGVAEATWNQPGNTIIVQSGDLFTAPDPNFTFLCNVTIEDGGFLILNKVGNKRDFNFANGTYLRVEGTLNTSNNVSLNLNGVVEVTPTGNLNNSGSSNNEVTIGTTGSIWVAGSISSGGDFTVNGAANISGFLTALDVVVDGYVNGSGTIVGNNSIGGSGTINGETTSVISSPLNLVGLGFEWNGNQWVGTASGSSKSGLTTLDKAIIAGADYSTSNGPIIAAALEVASGSLIIEDGDSVIISGKVLNNATIEVIDNGMIDAFAINSNSTGQVIAKRNFSRTGWHMMGFPTTGSQTLSSINASGISFDVSQTAAQNVYQWDASNSQWTFPSSSTSIASEAFIIYADSANGSLTLNMDATDLNLGSTDLFFTYHNPGAATNGSTTNGTDWTSTVTDGFNLLANHFPGFIDWDLVGNLPNSFDNAVYVWDGNGYKSYVNGIGDQEARFIAPNQAFFMRNTSGAGLLNISPSAITQTPSTFNDVFKTAPSQLRLVVSGQTDTASTWLTEDPYATNGFDGSFDAIYMTPLNNSLQFNSVNMSDSSAYSIQTTPNLSASDLVLSFNAPQQDGNAFTIALDPAFRGQYNHVYLRDKVNGQVVDLMQMNYTFSQDESAPAQRFGIVFKQTETTTGVYESESFQGAHVWVQNGGLQAKGLNGVRSVQLYAINGEVLDDAIQLTDIAIPQNGLYIVRVSTEAGTYTQKLTAF